MKTIKNRNIEDIIPLEERKSPPRINEVVHCETEEVEHFLIHILNFRRTIPIQGKTLYTTKKQERNNLNIYEFSFKNRHPVLDTGSH